MTHPYNKIIQIHGAPRSGTSWLAQIFDSSPNTRYKYQPLFSDSFKDYISVRSSKENIDEFFNKLYNLRDDFLDRKKEKQKKIYPEFSTKNTNPEVLLVKMVRYHYLIPRLLSDIDEIKVIGIIRNPCAVINSWRKAQREFLPEWNFNEEWRFGQSKNRFKPEEYFGFHKWKEISKLFLVMQKEFPGKFYLIRYENLIKDPLSEISKLFVFCNLKIDDQTYNFIHESRTIHQADAYSVFKGNKNPNDWKNELDSIIINEITKELAGTEFESFLY